MTKDRYKLNQSAGFTLVELLVVMAIIGILVSVLWINYTSSVIKGRDSKRKQDLENIARALELFYYDNKHYPDPTTPLPAWGSAFVHPTTATTLYMSQLPGDPKNNPPYCYASDDTGTYYQLYANLENEADPRIIPTVTCNSNYYNYGLSSSNTTP